MSAGTLSEMMYRLLIVACCGPSVVPYHYSNGEALMEHTHKTVAGRCFNALMG